MCSARGPRRGWRRQQAARISSSAKRARVAKACASRGAACEPEGWRRGGSTAVAWTVARRPRSETHCALLAAINETHLVKPSGQRLGGCCQAGLCAPAWSGLTGWSRPLKASDTSLTRTAGAGNPPKDAGVRLPLSLLHRSPATGNLARWSPPPARCPRVPEPPNPPAGTAGVCCPRIAQIPPQSAVGGAPSFG